MDFVLLFSVCVCFHYVPVNTSLSLSALKNTDVDSAHAPELHDHLIILVAHFEAVLQVY